MACEIQNPITKMVTGRHQISDGCRFGVTKSVTGRHQISDGFDHFGPLGVTKSVTSLSTIPEGSRDHG